ncbi:MAG: hypothetical protein ACPG1A_08750 [Halioglobus sp.]
MSYEVHAESVEGNDVWFAHRLELPNGTQLKNSHVSSDAAALVVTLYRETSVGGRRREVTLLSIDGTTVPPASPVIGDYLSDTYSHDYWGGMDDKGHNFVYQLPYSGTDYTLEGGNDYSIEFKLTTTSYGVIRWANRLHVHGLNAV